MTTTADHLSGYPYKKEFNKLERFLFFCSGSDTELLKHCPRYDQTKQVGLGGIVLATTVIAFGVGFYAFLVVFGHKDSSPEAPPNSIWVTLAALAVGAIWALIIFNLDRFIVSISGPGDGTEGITWKEAGLALPRLALAGIIGFTLSKPLEIKIMESEIKLHLETEKKEIEARFREKNKETYEVKRGDVEQLKKQAIEEKTSLEAYREKFRLSRDTAEANYRNEERGVGGTGKAGFGEATKRREATYKLAQEEYERIAQETSSKLEVLEQRLRSYEEAIRSLESERDSAVKRAEQEADLNDGLVKRIMIAHELYPVASWTITFLFIIIELCPVLFKMLIPASSYDYLKENAKRMSLAENGIEISSNYSDSGELKSQNPEFASYSLADTKNTEVTKRLNIERELTEQAQEAFKKKISADISAHPENYVKRAEDKPKS